MPARASSPSREFMFVAACCAWPLNQNRMAAVRIAAADNRLDWNRFLRIAALHRVEGLVNYALIRAEATAPEAIRSELGAAAAALVRENLELAAEAVRLQRLFATAGIPVLFLKGITLAILAYGNIGLRHGKDIDLLVAPENVAAAVTLIQRAGYRRHDPPPELNEALVQSLRPIRKDSSFFHEDRPFEVELHWRLLDNPHMMGAISIATSSQQVRVGADIVLPTFAEEDLFAYLCAHGANHCWYRLKWLADVGALLGAASSSKIETLFEAAEVRGAGPAAAQALLLCERLFTLPMPQDLLSRLRNSLRARWLERIALWAMTTGNEEIVPPDIPFGATKLTLSRYLLRSSWRYWLTELRIQLTSTRDMLMLPLPSRLQFLYPVLRVPLWICRRMMGRAH